MLETALILLIGAILGFLINQFLGPFLGKNNFLANFGRFLRSLFKRAHVESPNGHFSIGYKATSMFVLQGNGEYSYRKDSLQAIYHDGTPSSPDDIADRILRKERALEKARADGDLRVWPGMGVGFENVDMFLTSDEENIGASITFYKTTYPAFQATVLEIGAEDRDRADSIYKMHLADREPGEIIPYLARHIGVVVVVVTSDGFVIATQRTKNVHARPGEYDVSVVEGIEPTKDADISGGVTKIDIFKTVARGCNEELGLVLKDEDKIEILGLAVDQKYYQFNFYAVVRLDSLTFNDLASQRNGKARDEWEGRVKPIANKIDEMLKFMNDNPMWDTAKLGFYWQLVNYYGKTPVEAKAAEIFNNV